MITFVTPTALPIEAATTMGVSVKESSNAIGKFGTGLKYAIAGILRLNGSVTIWIDADSYEFTAVETLIRDKSFRIVHCNGKPCGFTTELGKHWEPWQLFRELASNTLDEGGFWRRGEGDQTEGRTVIYVKCREVEEADRNESVFLGERETLVESSMGATIHAGESKHYYFRGIRAGSFNEVAPVTINVTDGCLSEDRLLDLDKVRTETAWSFRTATKWSKEFMLTVIPCAQEGDFWVRNMCRYTIGTCLPADLMAFLMERPKFTRHPAFKNALDEHIKKGGHGAWAELPVTESNKELLAAGEMLCKSVGVDIIPRSKVHFTQELDDNTLAVTMMDTREVWFSTKLVMLGRHEFLCGYLEEAIHAMTGFNDCTRNMQNALFSIIVTAHDKNKRWWQR